MKTLKHLLAICLILAFSVFSISVYSTSENDYHVSIPSLFENISEHPVAFPFHADYLLYPALPIDVGGVDLHYGSNYYGYDESYESSADHPYLYTEYYELVYFNILSEHIPADGLEPYLFKGKFNCRVQLLKGAAEGREYLEEVLLKEGAEPFKSTGGNDGAVSVRWYKETYDGSVWKYLEPAREGEEGATVTVSLSLLVEDTFLVTFEVTDRSGNTAEVIGRDGKVDPERSGSYDIKYGGLVRREYYPEFIKALANGTELVKIPFGADYKEAARLISVAKAEAAYSDFYGFPTITVNMLSFASPDTSDETTEDFVPNETSDAEGEASLAPDEDESGTSDIEGEGKNGGVPVAGWILIAIAAAAAAALAAFYIGKARGKKVLD